MSTNTNTIVFWIGVSTIIAGILGLLGLFLFGRTTVDEFGTKKTTDPAIIIIVVLACLFLMAIGSSLIYLTESHQIVAPIPIPIPLHGPSPSPHSSSPSSGPSPGPGPSPTSK